ncbi:hypothetical protein IWW38_000817 [Coemansia aciculifera]|uniref:Uncharacterized protein n=1 Tax=Coemansia aciculifera TaxID=417176 RepID=A0ACC1M9X4_9FUNG|nr:hypothetical protein IWW38_000817 [Coemansia aciculifera]
MRVPAAARLFAIFGCIAVAEIQERVIEQPLDHFSGVSAGPWFWQRYYVDNQYYRADGPILLYSVGERTAQASDLSNGFIGDLAKETGGLVVLLEQRFYGNSVPDFNGTNVWQYLTVEQMMADIRRFSEHIDHVILEWTTLTRHRRTRTSMPLVLVGGSFAGSLMVWTRQRYPDLKALAVASSAPLSVVDGYWEFDKMVAQRLPCAKTLSLAVCTVDRVLDSGDAARINELKRQFGLDYAKNVVDIVTALTIQVSSLMQAPADEQSRVSIAAYCSQLERSDMTGVEALALMTREYGQRHRLVSISECPQRSDNLAWLWQQCTELGMWQTAPQVNSSSAEEAAWFSRRLRSRRLDVRHYKQQCDKCFPLSVGESTQFRAFSKKTLNALMHQVPSDVLLTAGELDPWFGLTAVGRGVRVADNAMVVRNASHAEDLLSSETEDGIVVNPGVLVARKRIVEAVQQWSLKNRRIFRNGDNPSPASSNVSLLLDSRGLRIGAALVVFCVLFAKYVL